MTAPWRRTLAILQIAGGALTLAGYVASLQLFGLRLVAWLLVLALLFGLGPIYVGLELLRGTRRGIGLSMLVQALQTVNASVATGWRYVFFAGPKVMWVVAGTGTGVDVGGGGSFLLDPTAVDATLKGIGLSLEVGAGVWPHPLTDATWAIGVNVYALVAFVRLWDAYERAKPSAGAAEPSTSEEGAGRTEPPAVAV